MRKVLYILSLLRDQDIDWLLGSGKTLNVPTGAVLVHQGKALVDLFIVLKGKFSVKTSERGTVTELGVGEIIGEMSFLDPSLPAAAVTAAVPSVVLAIPISRLQSKLKTDLPFAARFYQALGVLLASRLREMMRQSQPSDDDLDDTADFDQIDLAAARFEDLLNKALTP